MRRHISQSIAWAALLVAIAGFSLAPSAARGQLNVNISAGVNFSAGLHIDTVHDFYDPLAGFGVWFDLSPYGQIWQPAQVDAAWRPYQAGHWEWTDVGWYWVSDEPWAWATYHYGSWVDNPTYGWLWVPGTTWAPSWVVWRESPQYIGWAPCGPNGLVLPAPLFVFVDIHRFHSHFGPHDLIVNNPTIINRTTVINNFRTVDRTFDGGARRRVVVNEGPGVNVVERAAGTRFTPRPVREVVSQEPVPGMIQRRGSDLNIQRPVLRESATASAGNYRDRQPVRRGSEQNGGQSGIQGGASQRSSTSRQPQQQQQNAAQPVSPTGREQRQTFPQTGRDRQPAPEQPRVTPTPAPQTPQTTPPRTSQPSETDRTRSSRDRIDQTPTQRPSQFEPGQPTMPSTSTTRPERPQTQPTSPPPQEKAPEVNREPRTPPQTLPPPTGREQPRTYPPPEQTPGRPVPERPEVHQPERPTPPATAREHAPQEPPREQVHPPQPPPEHPTPPPHPEQPSKEGDKERDRP